MEIFVIELILWIGFALFFLVIKNRADQAASEDKTVTLQLNANPNMPIQFDQPDQLTDPIGTYQDAPIYRHATIKGRNYEFWYVLPPEIRASLSPGECYLNPGLVYRPC